VRNGTCKADKQFKFKGIPFCVLLDTEGKVVFMGHPANRKFEDDFTKLLAGEKITGKGTTQEAEGDSVEKDDGSAKEMSGEVLSKALTNFNEGVAKAKKEVGDKAKGLMRAFLVLVQDSKFDTKSGIFKTSLKHYQVLVGQAAGVKAIEDAAAGLRDKSHPWETILNKQAM